MLSTIRLKVRDGKQIRIPVCLEANSKQIHDGVPQPRLVAAWLVAQLPCVTCFHTNLSPILNALTRLRSGNEFIELLRNLFGVTTISMRVEWSTKKATTDAWREQRNCKRQRFRRLD